MIKKLSVLLSVLFFASLSAQEEEALEMLLFEEVPMVISSTLIEQKIEEAPSLISVITKAQIKARGYRKFTDIYRDLVGMSYKNHALGDESFMFRMSDTYRYKVLINGTDVIEIAWGTTTPWTDMPLDNIKQIEIIRGPGGALYGAQAFDGVINIITEGRADDNTREISVWAGSEDHYGGNATVKISGNDAYMNLALSTYESNQTQLKMEGDAYAGMPFSLTPSTYTADIERQQIMSNFAWKKLQGDVIYIDTSKDNFMGFSNALVDNDDNRSDYSCSMISLKLPLDISENFSVTPKIVYREEDREWVDGLVMPENFTTGMDMDMNGFIDFWPQGVRSYSTFTADLYSYELLASYNTEKTDLKIGLFYEESSAESEDIINYNPVLLYPIPLTDVTDIYPTMPDSEREIESLFFQYFYKFTDTFSFILGGRYDDISDVGSTFTPRAGVIFSDEENVMKLLYGEGFRAPYFNELYSENILFVANDDLESEEVKTTELYFSRKFNESFTASASFFMTEWTNLLGFESLPNGFFAARNFNDADLYGVELEAEYTIGQCRLFSNYFFRDGDLTENNIDFEQDLSIFKLGFDWLLTDNVSFYTSFVYVGDYDRVYEIANRQSSKAFSDVNIALQYTKGDFWVTVAVTDLFDEANENLASLNNCTNVESTGTNFTIKAGYSF